MFIPPIKSNNNSLDMAIALLKAKYASKVTSLPKIQISTTAPVKATVNIFETALNREPTLKTEEQIVNIWY